MRHAAPASFALLVAAWFALPKVVAPIPATLLIVLASIPAMWWFAGLALAPEIDRRGGWLALAAIVALALPLRLVGLDLYPMSVENDAGLNTHFAYGLEGRPWTPFTMDKVGVGVETAFFYLMLYVLRTFGHTLWVLGVPAVICSIAALPALFLFARELCGRSVALVACLFATVSPWGVVTGRSSTHSMLVPPVICLGYYLLLRALREGRAWQFVLGGFVTGCGMQTNQSYRHCVPAAVVTLVFLTWVERRPLVGLARGFGWFVLGLVAPLAPVVRYIAEYPMDWLQPFLQNTTTVGGVTGFASAAAEAVRVAVFEIAALGLGGPGCGVSLLFVAAIPLLFRWRDRRGATLCVLFATMIVPPMVARFHLTVPRRYVALHPAIYTLAALAAVEGVRAAGAHRRAARLAVAVAVVGLLVQSLTFLATFDPPDWPSPEREAVLRLALEQANADPALEVYLPDAFPLRDDYALAFFFLHGRIKVLPENVPIFPRGEGEILLLSAHARIGAAASALYGGRLVSLDLPVAPRGMNGRLDGLLLPRTRNPALDLGRSGLLAVPRDGRYSISLPEGVRGELIVEGRRVLVATGADERRDVALGAGIARYEVVGTDGSEPWALAWSAADGGSEPPPFEDCAFPGKSSGAVGLLRAAAASTVPLRWRFESARTLPVSIENEYHRYAQDVAAPGVGDLLVVRLEALERVGAGEPVRIELREPDGEQVRFGYGYDVVPAKSWSLAVDCDGTFVVARRALRYGVARLEGRLATTRWVRRYDATGQILATYEPPGGWQEPLDVAVSSGGLVAVADAGRGEVCVFGRAGELRLGARLQRPVSVAWLGDELYAVDANRLAIARLAPDGKVARWQFVGRVEEDTRLEPIAGRDWLVLLDGVKLRTYTRSLELVALAGTPASIDSTEPDAPYVACAWDDRAAELVVLDAQGTLVRHRLIPAPMPREGAIEIAACARLHFREGTIDASGTSEFGAGIATDGGRRPARARYAVEVARAGRYRVWTRFATGDARPYTIAIGGMRLAADGAVTGGFRRLDLAWEAAGEVELPAGTCELEVVAADSFPHVERFALEPVE